MGKEHHKHWPKGRPYSLNYPDIPVFELLNQTVRKYPDRIAIIFAGQEITYRELHDLVCRFARALHEMGVKKGERVAIHLANCPQSAIAYYALLMNGAVFVPLSPLLVPRELEYQLNDAGVETLISLDLVFPSAREILAATKIKRVITTSLADTFSAVVSPLKPVVKIPIPDTEDFVDLLKRYEPKPPEVSIDPNEDLAHLAYTGGTTGVSKGVMVTHKHVVTMVLMGLHWFGGGQVKWENGVLTREFAPGESEEEIAVVREGEGVQLVVVPWFHAMGAIGYLNGPICSGATMVVFPRFDPKEYLTAVPKYKANIIGGAPQLYIPIVNLPEFDSIDLSSLKVVASGAAPLPRSVIDKLLARIPGVVCEAYGLTECTMGAVYNPPSREGFKAGSVGIPIFDTEIKIVDPRTGRELPAGEVGEVLIKGPQVMKGYWNKPEETAKVLRDGWLWTGDLGYLDNDGYLFLVDRSKDMIIYKGYNVYPREIEEVMFKHPAVAQCAVVGKPDASGGEVPVAFVVLKPGMQVSAEELMQYCAANVAPYKKVREVIFRDEIPVSGAGKVLKRKLREELLRGN